MVFFQMAVLAGLSSSMVLAQKNPYQVTSFQLPEHVKLEAGGLSFSPEGQLAVGVRKGEIWMLRHPEANPSDPKAVGYRLFAEGLHEVLGVKWWNNELYAVQRSELTKLVDSDKDGKADSYETAGKGWGVSGNYHEYAYGPAPDREGNLWITLNASMGPAVKMPGFTLKDKPWRGWAVIVNSEGQMIPMAAGLRSPCGIAENAEGDIFSTDQQGNWIPTNSLVHLRKGAFFGHGDAVADTKRPDSPVKDPGVLPQDLLIPEAAKKIPGFALPAVWFPYVKVGQSPTGLVCDTSGGKFGPFAGQFFVGEFVLSCVTRVFLEKVEGEYQGAVFNFVDGLQSAALSLAFSPKGELFVGQSNRGWNSKGTRSYGLEKITWDGKMPFEIQKMEAAKDGFHLTFTKPLDLEKSKLVPESFPMSSYTYLYHSKYGSEEMDTNGVKIAKVEVSEDGRKVHLVCEGLREGYVHELSVKNLFSKDQEKLGHPEAYYTLNRIPRK